MHSINDLKKFSFNELNTFFIKNITHLKDNKTLNENYLEATEEILFTSKFSIFTFEKICLDNYNNNIKYELFNKNKVKQSFIKQYLLTIKEINKFCPIFTHYLSSDDEDFIQAVVDLKVNEIDNFTNFLSLYEFKLCKYLLKDIDEGKYNYPTFFLIKNHLEEKINLSKHIYKHCKITILEMANLLISIGASDEIINIETSLTKQAIYRLKQNNIKRQEVESTSRKRINSKSIITSYKDLISAEIFMQLYIFFSKDSVVCKTIDIDSLVYAFCIFHYHASDINTKKRLNITFNNCYTIAQEYRDSISFFYNCCTCSRPHFCSIEQSIIVEECPFTKPDRTKELEKKQKKQTPFLDQQQLSTNEQCFTIALEEASYNASNLY